MHDELLTPPELAQLLRVPLGTIYGWRHRRVGPTAYKVGRHLRYSRSGVDEWLLRQSADGPAREHA